MPSSSSSSNSSSSTEIKSSSSTSSSSTEIKSSSSTSSSSTEIRSSSSSSNIVEWSILQSPIVAMASRTYGEGRILIHTDRIGAFQTGHNDNPKTFWRKILEWTSNKKTNELIKVGLIINTNSSSANRMTSFSPLTVLRLKISDIAIRNISSLNCLYFVGLPDAVSSSVALKIKNFVENGGGLIIETPNRGLEDINILSSIESLFCYSSNRLLQTGAYWTLDGTDHPVYYKDALISFMSTLRQMDFSEYWTILMTNIQNEVTTTTTTPFTGVNVSVVGKSSAEFGVSFINAFQKGIVILQGSPYEYASSSSSLSSSSLSSSSHSVSSSSTEIRSSSSSSTEIRSSSSTEIRSSSSTEIRSSSSDSSSSTEIRSSSSTL